MEGGQASDSAKDDLVDEDVHVGVCIFSVHHTFVPVVTGQVEDKERGSHEVVESVPESWEFGASDPEDVVDQHEPEAELALDEGTGSLVIPQCEQWVSVQCNRTKIDIRMKIDSFHAYIRYGKLPLEAKVEYSECVLNGHHWKKEGEDRDFSVHQVSILTVDEAGAYMLVAHDFWADHLY